uniref:Uncharacterized protein n=1 Tax=Arion vulgaris TaxID=1028688 RepID=A0A0B7AR36_9EUPU
MQEEYEWYTGYSLSLQTEDYGSQSMDWMIKSGIRRQEKLIAERLQPESWKRYIRSQGDYVKQLWQTFLSADLPCQSHESLLSIVLL